jgi:alpha-L-arabinofuranosidase
MGNILKFNIVILLLFSINIYGQNNLITKNPGLEANTDGWNGLGSNYTLSHVTAGAQTTGAAKFVVTGSGARFQSDNFTIPNSLQEKIIYLTFYAKASEQLKVRVFFSVNNQTSGYRTKKVYCSLNTGYQLFCVPIRLKAGDNSGKVQIRCEENTGTYFFDDFDVSNDYVEPDQIDQFEQSEAKTFEIPDNIQEQTLNAGSSNIKITIDKNMVLAPVLSAQFGVNSNFRSKNGLENRAHLYEQFGAFRFPAGSGSDIYFWDGVRPSFHQNFGFYSGTASNFLDLSHYAQFKQSAKGQGTIVVNYGYARYGAEASRSARVQAAADLAAGFVHKMNIDLDAEIKYWEVGNENYGGWEAGHEVNDRGVVTGKEYGEDFCVFADAMKAVDPNIKVGAVLYNKAGSWNRQVMIEVKDHADYFIVHHYFNNIQGSEASMSATVGLQTDMQEIQKYAKVFTGKPEGYFPVNLTEFNSQGEQTITISNGLFVADALGAIVKNHYNLTTIWVNEWGLSNNETHGIIAKDDPNQADYTTRPSYTPYYYYGKCFGDQMIKSTVTGSDDIRSYASKYSSGEIGIVAINFSDEEKKVVFENVANYDTVYWYTVNAENTNAGNTKFYVNGETSTTTGGGPENLDDVPANRAKISADKYFILPKYSANYIVLTSSGTTTGFKDRSSNKNYCSVFPNPGNKQITITGKKSELLHLKWLNTKGQTVGSMVKLINDIGNKQVYDISVLPQGIYFVKTKTATIKFYKQ